VQNEHCPSARKTVATRQTLGSKAIDDIGSSFSAFSEALRPVAHEPCFSAFDAAHSGYLAARIWLFTAQFWL
jgi:hypothetical protein